MINFIFENKIFFLMIYTILTIVLLIGFNYYELFFYKKEKINNYKFSFLNFVLKNLFFLCFYIFLSLSFFSYGENDTSSNDLGSNIFFIFDVSKSMDAEDVLYKGQKISRLNFAKNITSEYIDSNNFNNYGIIAFAGSPQKISPLTKDKSVLKTTISSISTESIIDYGTSFKNLFDGLLAFGNKEQNINYILFSDGEDLGESDYNYSGFSEYNIKLFTIGLGSKKGAYIPNGFNFFGEKIYKTFNGDRVVTRLNEDNLVKIAKKLDGEYYNNEEDDLIKKIENNFLKEYIPSNQNIININYLYVFIALFALFLFTIFDIKK